MRGSSAIPDPRERIMVGEEGDTTRLYSKSAWRRRYPLTYQAGWIAERFQSMDVAAQRLGHRVDRLGSWLPVPKYSESISSRSIFVAADCWCYAQRCRPARRS